MAHDNAKFNLKYLGSESRSCQSCQKYEKDGDVEHFACPHHRLCTRRGIYSPQDCNVCIALQDKVLHLGIRKAIRESLKPLRDSLRKIQKNTIFRTEQGAKMSFVYDDALRQFFYQPIRPAAHVQQDHGPSRKRIKSLQDNTCNPNDLSVASPRPGISGMHEENTLRQFSIKPSNYHHDGTPTNVGQTDGEHIVCEVDVVKQEPSDEEVICLSSPGNKDVPVYRMVDSGMLARIESMHARIESMLMTRPGMTGVTQQPSDPQPGCSYGNNSNDSLSHFKPRQNK